MDFFSKCEDFFTLTEETLTRKLPFLCGEFSDTKRAECETEQ